MLAASHARTYHQLATMLELAGFEVLDMLVWSYANSRPVGADLGDGWRSLLKRGHEPWAIVRKPLAPRQVPGKKPGSLRKAPPTVADTFQRFGTAGFLVVDNGQEGQAWASNVLRVEKDRPKGVWDCRRMAA